MIKVSFYAEHNPVWILTKLRTIFIFISTESSLRVKTSSRSLEAISYCSTTNPSGCHTVLYNKSWASDFASQANSLQPLHNCFAHTRYQQLAPRRQWSPLHSPRLWKSDFGFWPGGRAPTARLLPNSCYVHIQWALEVRARFGYHSDVATLEVSPSWKRTLPPVNRAR